MMAEEGETPSTLFKSLLGQITQEQWETYKELRRVSGDLVCSESSDSVTSEDEADSADEASSATANSAKDQEKDGESEDADMSEGEAEPEARWGPDLTMKYVKGELSFDDFVKIIEKTQAEEESLEAEEERSKAGKEPTKAKETSSTSKTSSEKDIQQAQKEFAELLSCKKKKKSRSNLPKDLQGLMGEANLCFARGEHEDAIKMCMEIIRLAPTAPEPFQTLGMLYEDLGDMEKCFQFSLIAAHLKPSNYEDWVKLAEMYVDRGKIREAISCYNKAIRYDPKNIGFLWERCNLYEQLGDKKKALEGYEAIVQNLTQDQGDQCLQLSREIVKIYHEQGEITSAVQAMEKAFEKFPLLITSEDVNTLLELKMSLNQHEDSIKILHKHCGIEFEPNVQEDQPYATTLQAVHTCTLPDCLPIDLQVKLIVCLIHLRVHHLVKELCVSLFDEDPELVGDLFLHVAEAYMAVGEHHKALPILEILLKTKNFYLAAVLLHYADCLSTLGRHEEAIPVYEKVMEMAPTHSGAKMSYATTLENLGRYREAANKALLQEFEKGNEEEPVDLDVLWRRCNLLYTHEMWPEFTEAGKLLFRTFFLMLERPAEFQAVVAAQLRRRSHMEEVYKEIGHPDKPEPVFKGKRLSTDEMWEFYVKYCKKLYEIGDLENLWRVTMSALTSRKFAKDVQRKKECDFLAFLACYYAKKASYAYSFIKIMAMKDVNSPRIWNMFCQIVNMLQDIRHNRFCLRLLFKNPDNVPLGLLNGHSAVLAGSYKHALGEYMCVFRQTPNDPFVCLCIGLTFIHMACQKYAVKRHSLVMQGCAFLNQYLELRGECQESYYNLGRAMHQLGLLSAALHYYKKALRFRPPVSGNDSSVLDLRCEIAYNLSLIYHNSGAYDLALMYIQKYCII